jgi:hypothetical protein
MIRHFLLFLVFYTAIPSSLWAQDTTAYEIQRLKINGLLGERSAKFGQYDQSLNERTGIFGFQTKRDIRNSNEILRQIALTDNDIFKELKILLDYKDLQVEQVRTSINNSSERMLNYRKTIKDLQTQNQELNDKLDRAENENTFTYLFMFIFLIGCGILAYFWNENRKKLKHFELKAER